MPAGRMSDLIGKEVVVATRWGDRFEGELRAYDNNFTLMLTKAVEIRQKVPRFRD
jgi:small nuclear ribonucleoprotein (snRNP)-like protein